MLWLTVVVGVCIALGMEHKRRTRIERESSAEIARLEGVIAGHQSLLGGYRRREDQQGRQLYEKDVTIDNLKVEIILLRRKAGLSETGK